MKQEQKFEDSLFEQSAQITKAHAYDILVEQVKELKEENAAKLGYNNYLEKENEKIKRLLHDLTPGGSEFYNSPEYCAEWIRKNREENHYLLAGMVKELKEDKRILIEALERLKAAYDNVEDLAGVVAKEALSKIKY